MKRTSKDRDIIHFNTRTGLNNCRTSWATVNYSYVLYEFRIYVGYGLIIPIQSLGADHLISGGGGGGGLGKCT